MAPQLMATKAPSRRGPLACSARANTSLPTPDSPWISTGIGLPTTRRALSAALRQRASPVSSCARASTACTGAAASGAATAPRADASAVPGHAAGSLCTCANSRAPPGRRTACGCCGRRWWCDSRSSSRASTTRSSSVAPTSLALRPSWARAARLAPTIQPSPDTATMPSATLPMPSGSRCRCRRMLRLQAAASRRFSIMRAAVLTRPSVCACPWR